MINSHIEKYKIYFLKLKELYPVTANHQMIPQVNPSTNTQTCGVFNF